MRSYRKACFGHALILCGVGNAFAQSAPQPPTDSAQGAVNLQEIVVTARKQAEDLQKVPMAITALNAQMLQDAQINSNQDLERVAPSVVSHAQGGFGNSTTIAIRGFFDALPTNLLGDSAVAQYLDGVYIGRDAGDAFSLVDMDRVEIEAGPQGTLYGRNATGGAVSFYTQAPAEVFGIRQKVSYGTYGDILSRTTVDTGEIFDTGFYAKFAYMHHQRNGYVRNTLSPSDSDDPGAINADSYFFALHGDLGSHVTVDYKFDWDNESDVAYSEQTILGSPAFVALHGSPLSGPPFAIAGGPGPGGSIQVQPNFESTVTQTYLGRQVQNVGGHNLTLVWNINDAAQFKSISAYRSLFLNVNDNFGGDPPNIGLLLNPVTFAVTPGPIPVLDTQGSRNHQHQLSEELQFLGKAGPFSYVVGLYYFDEHVSQNSLFSQATFPIGLPGLGTPIGATVDSLYSGESFSRAAYLNGNYTPRFLDEKLEISAGVRYTADEKSIDQLYSGGPLDPAVVANKNFNNTSESGSLKYQWTHDLMTYFRAGTAYRAGGFNPAYTSETVGANSYQPEHVTSYELGLKSDWFGGRMRLNSDIYYTDYTNLQLALIGTCPAGSTSCGFSGFTGNAGHATYKGLESQITVLPADHWQVNATVGLIDPKYLLYQLVQNGPNVASQAKFDFLPEETASADLQYAFAPLAIGNLVLRGDWSYKSRIYFGTTAAAWPSLQQGSAPPFNNVGAEIMLNDIPLHWGRVKLDAEVYGKNLIGKHDVISETDFLPSLGFANEIWGLGREFGVMLNGRFQ